MTNWNSDWSRRDDHEFIELFELDFEDLPPTDPVGARPSTLLPPSREVPRADFSHLKRMLRQPVCVVFEDDRSHDVTPPPVEQPSTAPLAASLPPTSEPVVAKPHASWTLALAAVASVAAIGFVTLRAHQQASAHPSSPAAITHGAIAAIPNYAPEDFPIVPGAIVDEHGVEWEWIDLRDAPREDLPKPKAAGPVPSVPATIATRTEVSALPAPAAALPDRAVEPDSEQPPPALDNVEPERPFDRDQAAASLNAAASAAQSCTDGTMGFARVATTFAPSGRATTATVSGTFAGTTVGGCIAKTFRGAHVQPFDGALITVHKTLILR